jgi:hypothetical protein
MAPDHIDMNPSAPPNGSVGSLRKVVAVVPAIVAALVVAIAAALISAECGTPSTLRELLLSDDEAGRIRARNQILGLRAAHIAELSTIVRDADSQLNRPASVQNAIEILGDLRAVEAIDVLVNSIAFPFVRYSDPPITPAWTISRDAEFPSANALAKIGEPSIMPVAKRIAVCDAFDYLGCQAVLMQLRSSLNADLMNQAMDLAEATAKDEMRRADISNLRVWLQLPPPAAKLP